MPALRLRLHETDRARLGCPEWLEIDLSTITNREAIAFRHHLGFATPTLLREALIARPVLDGNGDKVVDGRGDPVVQVSELAWTGVVWAALRRSGVDTDLASLEFMFEALQFDVPQPVELEEPVGKAPAAPARSTRSTSRS